MEVPVAPLVCLSPMVNVYSDASGGWGSGALAGWFKVPWPSDWQSVDIYIKELVPVAIAAAIWGPWWSGLHVCFYLGSV